MAFKMMMATALQAEELPDVRPEWADIASREDAHRRLDALLDLHVRLCAERGLEDGL